MKLTHNITTLAASASAALLIGMTGNTNAATIVYDFDTSNTAFSAGPVTVLAATADNDFGAGVTVSDYVFSTPANARNIGIIGGETWALASADDQTHTFTVTIDAATTVNIGNLAWLSGSMQVPHSWDLEISVGGVSAFTSSIAAEIGFEANVRREANNSESLSGTAALQGLTNTFVTIQITDTTGGNSPTETIGSFIDNVTLTGAVVAVPEPSTTALLGLGGLALILRRRR